MSNAPADAEQDWLARVLVVPHQRAVVRALSAYVSIRQHPSGYVSMSQ